MSDNKAIWDRVKRPPKSALKQIGGGRLKGMTDISPQWRYEIMTEVFGCCGNGWWYTIDKLWTEAGNDGEVAAFAQITLYTKEGPYGISGVGGSMFVAAEKSGLHTSDEAYKMAVTDAVGVAMKQLGVAADIYMGMFDGSKYKDEEEEAYKLLCDKWADSILAIKDGIKNNDLSSAKEAWDELSEADKMALWKAPTKGGCFTTEERAVMKSTEFRNANGGAK